MKRSRAITAVLSLVLVACAAVIFMDQNGMLGAESGPSSTTISPAPSSEPSSASPAPETAPSSNNNSDYGGLK